MAFLVESIAGAAVRPAGGRASVKSGDRGGGRRGLTRGTRECVRAYRPEPLAMFAKEVAEVVGEQVGGFHCGEVPAAVEL
jgi:hypothetical protein